MATVLIDKLLEACVKQGASDIHITTGQPPVFRLHGRLRKLETKVLESEDTVALMKSIAPERCQRELQEMGSADFGFAYADKARFRVSIFKQRGDIAMVLRQIPNEMMPPEFLGVSDIFTKLVHASPWFDSGDRPDRFGQKYDARQPGELHQRERGPSHHHDRRPDRVLSLPQKIDRQPTRSRSRCAQFSEAIRRALRQDPDVILVGELRDLETIQAAITAAETGHIVFGTLHTNSAQGTVNRIIDAFPGNLQDQIRTQLSTSLIGVLAQTLLPRIGGGRIAAFESLVVTPGIANLIRENKTFRINSAIQTGAKFGMMLTDDCLFDHWVNERVEMEDVLGKAHDPDSLAKRIATARRQMEEGGMLDEDDLDDG